MMHTNHCSCSASNPVNSSKVAVSFAFINAASFFSALRFYFYFFFMPSRAHLKRVTG